MFEWSNGLIHPYGFFFFFSSIFSVRLRESKLADYLMHLLYLFYVIATLLKPVSYKHCRCVAQPMLRISCKVHCGYRWLIDCRRAFYIRVSLGCPIWFVFCRVFFLHHYPFWIPVTRLMDPNMGSHTALNIVIYRYYCCKKCWARY